jgi:HEPN domain-containing protein
VSGWSEAREWFVRAKRDLQAARSLLDAERPLADISVYHAQQAAEKALKAFLAFHHRPIRKTHDLLALLAECVALDPDFQQLQRAAQALGPYGTRFRYPYPGMPLAPSNSEADTAVELASSVLDLVRPKCQ